MLDILHLTRGVLLRFSPSYFGYSREEHSPLLSELTFPFRYLKSVFAEDLFGMPHSDFCFTDEPHSSLENLGGVSQNGYVR